MGDRAEWRRSIQGIIDHLEDHGTPERVLCWPGYTIADLISDLDSDLDQRWSDGIDAMGEDS